MSRKPLALPADFRFLNDYQLGEGPARELAAMSRRWQALLRKHPILDGPHGEIPAEAARPLQQLLVDLDSFTQANVCGPKPRPSDLVEEIRQMLRSREALWRVERAATGAVNYAASIESVRRLWRRRIGHPPKIRKPADEGAALDALDQLEQELDRRFPAKEAGTAGAGRQGAASGQGQQEAGSSPQASTPSGPQWLTVREAARASGCNPGQVTRAVNKGQLKSNGEGGRKRRIDAADLALWQLRRADRGDAVESDAAVEEKLKRARGQ
jgi:hypothetical protein